MPEEILIKDSVTVLDAADRGKVLVAGSHGAVTAAYIAAKGGVRGLILNDAGIGRDQAGISGLTYLEALNVPGATVAHSSARIGDGQDMMRRGIISRMNAPAATLGVHIGQTCAEAAENMLAAPAFELAPEPRTDTRFLISAVVGEPEVWGLDSVSMITPEDARRIVVTGSHGELLGGRPETALKYDALAALFSDAGIGVEGAGTSRLPALDDRRIAAATVSADSARIGDAKSIYEDGVISSVNETARVMGGAEGQSTRAFIAAVIAGIQARDRSL